MAAKIFILILCVLVIWRFLLVVKPGMVEKFSSEKEKGRKIWTRAFRLFASIRYYSTFLICAFVGFAPTEFFIPSIYHAENGENHLPSWETVLLIFLGGLVASTVISFMFYIGKNALINKYYQNHLNLFDPPPGGFSQFAPPTSGAKEGGCSFRFMTPVFCIMALIGSVIEGEASVLKGILSIVGFVAIYAVVLFLLERIDEELEMLFSYKEMTKGDVVFIFASIAIAALFVVLFSRNLNGSASHEYFEPQPGEEIGMDWDVEEEAPAANEGGDEDKTFYITIKGKEYFVTDWMPPGATQEELDDYLIVTSLNGFPYTTVVTTRGDSLLIRENSTIESRVIEKIPSGGKIKVRWCPSGEMEFIQGQYGHWCMVEYNNKIGFSFSGYFKEKK